MSITQKTLFALCALSVLASCGGGGGGTTAGTTPVTIPSVPPTATVTPQALDTLYSNLTTLFTWSNVETYATFSARAQAELVAQTTYAVDTGNRAGGYTATYNPTTQIATFTIQNVLASCCSSVVGTWVTNWSWGLNPINTNGLAGVPISVPQANANAIVNLYDGRFQIEFKLDPTTPISSSIAATILPASLTTSYSSSGARTDSNIKLITAKVTKITLLSISTGQVIGSYLLP
jgi:hypothetical protein